MEYKEDFARLEQFVEKLIDSYNQLKNENSEINAQLLARQQEIDDLQEMIKSLEDERSVMRNRVSGLIDRIDEWEKNFEQEGSGQNTDSAGAGTQKKSSKKSSALFKATAEHPSESVLR